MKINDFSTKTQRATGLFFLRILLGLIFVMQGYGKLFTWGVDGVYQNAFRDYEGSWIPIFLLKATAYFTSYAELVGGALLVIGLFRQLTYLALGLVLLIVAYGHGLTSPIWDLHHIFFRAALLVALFLLPAEWDRWSLDWIFGKAKE